MKKLDTTAIRKKLKFSQSEFGALLGVSVRTIQEWDQGRSRPNAAATTLLRLADAGKLTAEEKPAAPKSRSK